MECLPALASRSTPTDRPDPSGAIMDFVRDFSLETTPRERHRIAALRRHLDPGTRVSIVALPGVDFADTIETAIQLRAEGLEPVPHFAARAVADRRCLAERLARLCGEAEVREVLVIAGGLARPAGAFDSSIALLETGLFDDFGIRRIGLAGHPEGNRDIGVAGLARALAEKNAFAARTDAALHLVTQFCFEAAPIIAWDRAIREAGNRLPIHIGIAGPASLKTLLRYARLCGVGPSARALARGARGLARLAATATPDRLIADLARYRARDPDCGIVHTHVYPFGAPGPTADWFHAVRNGDFVLRPGGAGFIVGAAFA